MAVQGHQGRKVHMQLFVSDQEFTISTQSWSYLASSQNIAGFLQKTDTNRYNSAQDFRKFLVDYRLPILGLWSVCNYFLSNRSIVTTV